MLEHDHARGRRSRRCRATSPSRSRSTSPAWRSTTSSRSTRSPRPRASRSLDDPDETRARHRHAAARWSRSSRRDRDRDRGRRRGRRAAAEDAAEGEARAASAATPSTSPSSRRMRFGAVGAGRLAGRRARQPGRGLRGHAAQRRLRGRSPSWPRRWDLPRAKDKFAGRFAEGRAGTGGPRVALLQPQTFMNESGRSAGPARGALKVDLDHVLVAARRDRPAVRRGPHARRRRARRPQRPEVAEGAGSASPDFAPRADRRRPPGLDRPGRRRRLRARALAAADGRGRSDLVAARRGRRRGARARALRRPDAPPRRGSGWTASRHRD